MTASAACDGAGVPDLAILLRDILEGSALTVTRYPQGSHHEVARRSSAQNLLFGSYNADQMLAYWVRGVHAITNYHTRTGHRSS